MKSVVILGSGNVAENLAMAVAGSCYQLLQIYARNEQRAIQISSAAGCTYSCDRSTLAVADIYIIAVSDRAIAEISAELEFPDEAIVAHTAGSVNIGALSDKIKNGGVLYPLQTFSSSRHVDFKNIPIFVEGANPKTTDDLLSLAQTLSTKASKMCYEKRLKLHLAAVFACNFANHMFALAQNILSTSDIDAHVLDPLIMETASKATSHTSAAELQTGPAVRGDLETQKRHIEQLGEQYELKNIYETVSLNIWETSKKI